MNGNLVKGFAEMIKFIGDKIKDFFMGLTHVQAGWVTVATVSVIVLLAIV